jgi:hypothetical protein
MFKNMRAGNQIDGHITQGVEELKFNQLSKILFNFKTGNWYNSKQHVVWDADYFSRHAQSRGASRAPLEIPNFMGVDLVQVIFGVGIKFIGSAQRFSTKAENYLLDNIPSLKRSSNASSMIENEIKDSVNAASSTEGYCIKSYHPFAIRQQDKVWTILDPTTQDSPVYFEHEEDTSDVFTIWARKFQEIKFYTLQKEGRSMQPSSEAENWL